MLEGPSELLIYLNLIFIIYILYIFIIIDTHTQMYVYAYVYILALYSTIRKYRKTSGSGIQDLVQK